MSDRRPTADHDRARSLAAARVDEAIGPHDAAFLDEHLAACDACAAIAAQYQAQTSLFAGLRAETVEAPRDLWARTSAALEAEASRRAAAPAVRRSRGLSRSRWFGGLLAPVATVAAIGILVGSGLLGPVAPGSVPGSASPSHGPAPTPVNVAAADVAIVNRDKDGTVRIQTRSVDQVCPMGSSACGITTEFSTATSATLGSSADLDAVISPGRDRVILFDRAQGAGGVYVVTVPVATTAPAPTDGVVTPGPSATATGGPTATPTVEPTPVTVPSSDPPTTPTASASPEVVATTDPAGSPAPTPDPTGQVSPTGAPDPSVAPESPSPSIAVSPAPDGAVVIASGVIVVGHIASYSPDGLRFAFTARPADGSAGPDVYVWAVGDAAALPVTSDHASVLAGWLGDRLLVSRLDDGKPGTVLLDPATGMLEAAGAVRTWLPVLDPTGRFAAWWDGTVVTGSDGVTPVAGEGSLVVGGWGPATGPAEDAATPDAELGAPVVLARGPLADWEVRWSADGTAISTWTATGAPGAPGVLALYRVDPSTGAADLAQPLLAPSPAYEGFALGDGRLAWLAPSDDGERTVQVLAWSDGGVDGRAELPAEQGTRVIR
jgi:hypothetical protein